MVVDMTRKLVFGVGINDSDCAVSKCVNGKQVVSQFYRKWANMLNRCYSDKYQKTRPTYAGCTVCDEWLVFSNFKSWMQKQDWQGKVLDKDIIVSGNKIYSPETCAFVESSVNNFITDSSAARGGCMIGVFFCNTHKKFVSKCNNPFLRKLEQIGYFSDELSAHLAWKKRKHELACQLANMQSDNRVADALRVRYL